MTTKYDVFAAIIEKSPCKQNDLDFKSPVYMHISSLQKQGWVRKNHGLLTPVKDKSTQNVFRIIRYCLNHGLDHNAFFTKSMRKVLGCLPQGLPELRPEQLKGNKEITRILKYLEQNQFILKHSIKPAKGRMLKHRLLEWAAEFHGMRIALKLTERPDLIQKILKHKAEPINPFEEKAFSFLAGSAQLEGSTITEGDTRELLLRGIYPDKPSEEIQMVKNLNEALKFIVSNKDREITPERIQEINKLVMFSLHANAGNYKITQNRIQGNPSFKTAKPEEVPRLVKGFCDELAGVDKKETLLRKLGCKHNQLQRIHPFSDGNSRTTRMVLNWIILKHELPIIILKMGSFDEYMSLTKLASMRDDENLNQLFLELIVHESKH
ncbi:MAG: Fic family protein [Nanoarchaeota archaeon]|nr:Fic family protein [Nanoarchaeota archaeon]